jgi:hypothetical protein
MKSEANERGVEDGEREHDAGLQINDVDRHARVIQAPDAAI